jgi:hypothetical protein
MHEEAHVTDHTKTPEATLAAATSRGALPNAAVTLLGTLHGPGNARALVRVNGSTIHTVEIGTVVGGATVAAIGEGVMILTRGTHNTRLSLPAS